MCLCIALKNLAEPPMGDAINAKAADVLPPLLQGQRQLHRHLMYQTRDHQGLMLQDLMQTHARRSVILPPITVHQHTAGISLSPLPKASLPNPIDCRFPPVILDAEDAEMRVVAVPTNSCHS